MLKMFRRTKTQTKRIRVFGKDSSSLQKNNRVIIKMRRRFPIHRCCHFWVTNGIKRDEIRSSASERPFSKKIPSSFGIWVSLVPMILSASQIYQIQRWLNAIVEPTFLSGSFIAPLSSCPIGLEGVILERDIRP